MERMLISCIKTNETKLSGVVCTVDVHIYVLLG